jgi:hypothetical protein
MPDPKCGHLELHPGQAIPLFFAPGDSIQVDDIFS